MKSKCATLLLATAVALSGTSAFAATTYKTKQHHASKSMNSMNMMKGSSGSTKSKTSGSPGGSTSLKGTGSSTSGGGTAGGATEGSGGSKRY